MSQIDTKRLARIAEKLERLTERTEGCWLWRGYTQPNGYGWLNLGGLKLAAHRAALLVAGTAAPPNRDVCHRCDVRNCVNPAHLYVGTRRQNMADCTARQRHNKPLGEQHWCAKLTAADVASIRRRRTCGETVNAIAVDFPVHPATISRISRGEWRKEVQ